MVTYLSSMSDDESAESEAVDTDWQQLWHRLHESLGRKWTFHVLRLLSERDVGFNEMKRELDGITAKTLSRRLRELRCRGFVERHVEATPPSTRYSLTEQGHTFVGALRELESLVTVVGCDDSRRDACAVVTRERPTTAVAAGECC
ncbi:transcriptional regulator, HxlR family [Halogranum rubrum]|uniref:Transcriptional regulator, HxlR family n=2 Tax=Halogranum rubrum TaxID=553466 RepID=A0A1I4EWJ3_9EURY|nr:transcriptional regulator, HxlR family [Halogranum rubrum]